MQQAKSRASAPGKLIVCGEHAVVHRRPALALPLPLVRAHATVERSDEGGIVCDAPDVGETWRLVDRVEHPLAQVIRATLRRLHIASPPSMVITIRSDIPIASGMGSGAATSAAIVRALAAFFAQPLPDSDVAALVYVGEQAYHGTPSGIDNTVVSYEQPVWFVRGMDGAPPTIEPIHIGAPLHLVIGDTGVRAPTYATVGGVRARWEGDPARYEALFDQIGDIVQAVRVALEQGQSKEIGALLDRNQALLAEAGVSSPELEHLIAAARGAGALGAKLSGGGGGGIMLALATPQTAAPIQAALHAAGAVRVLHTTVNTTHGAS